MNSQQTKNNANQKPQTQTAVDKLPSEMIRQIVQYSNSNQIPLISKDFATAYKNVGLNDVKYKDLNKRIKDYIIECIPINIFDPVTFTFYTVNRQTLNISKTNLDITYGSASKDEFIENLNFINEDSDETVILGFRSFHASSSAFLPLIEPLSFEDFLLIRNLFEKVSNNNKEFAKDFKKYFDFLIVFKLWKCERDLSSILSKVSDLYEFREASYILAIQYFMENLRHVTGLQLNNVISIPDNFYNFDNEKKFFNDGLDDYGSIENISISSTITKELFDKVSIEGIITTFDMRFTINNITSFVNILDSEKYNRCTLLGEGKKGCKKMGKITKVNLDETLPLLVKIYKRIKYLKFFFKDSLQTPDINDIKTAIVGLKEFFPNNKNVKILPAPINALVVKYMTEKMDAIIEKTVVQSKGGLMAQRKRKTSKLSFIKTEKKYTDSQKRVYVVYKKGDRLYIKKKSKTTGKFTYRGISP